MIRLTLAIKLDVDDVEKTGKDQPLDEGRLVIGLLTLRAARQLMVKSWP